MNKRIESLHDDLKIKRSVSNCGAMTNGGKGRGAGGFVGVVKFSNRDSVGIVKGGKTIRR